MERPVGDDTSHVAQDVPGRTVVVALAVVVAVAVLAALLLGRRARKGI